MFYRRAYRPPQAAERSRLTPDPKPVGELPPGEGGGESPPAGFLSALKYRRIVAPPPAEYWDEEGRTAMHVIASQAWDDERGVDEAVKAGCDVNKPDRRGCTPIYYAAKLGHVGCITQLIKHGSDLDTFASGGLNPVMVAARAGHASALQALLQAGARAGLANGKGETALHYAAGAERADCVGLLLAAGVDVNAKDNEGCTALMLASKQNAACIADALLAAKANANLIDSHGRAALHYAASADACECAAALIRHGRVALDIPDSHGDTAYVAAIKSDAPRVIQLLLDTGCDRNSIDGLMGTALALAALKGHARVVELLVANHEDPDEFGYFGMTPLMLAGFEGHAAAVDALLRGGADVNAPGRMGATALHKTLMKLSIVNEAPRHRIIARLLRAGADVNARLTNAGYFTMCTNGKNCPLSFAISAGYVSLVRMLLLAGHDVTHGEIGEWMELNNVRRFFDFATLLGPIVEWKSQPRSLMHSCRAVIRRSLAAGGRRGSLPERAIATLPIASSLKRYLDFSEFDDIMVERAQMTDGMNPSLVENLTISPCGMRALEGTLLQQVLVRGEAVHGAAAPSGGARPGWAS